MLCRHPKREQESAGAVSAPEARARERGCVQAKLGLTKTSAPEARARERGCVQAKLGLTKTSAPEARARERGCVQAKLGLTKTSAPEAQQKASSSRTSEAEPSADARPSARLAEGADIACCAGTSCWIRLLLAPLATAGMTCRGAAPFPAHSAVSLALADRIGGTSCRKRGCRWPASSSSSSACC